MASLLDDEDELIQSNDDSFIVTKAAADIHHHHHHMTGSGAVTPIIPTNNIIMNDDDEDILIDSTATSTTQTSTTTTTATTTTSSFIISKIDEDDVLLPSTNGASTTTTAAADIQTSPSRSQNTKDEKISELTRLLTPTKDKNSESSTSTSSTISNNNSPSMVSTYSMASVPILNPKSKTIVMGRKISNANQQPPLPHLLQQQQQQQQSPLLDSSPISIPNSESLSPRKSYNTDYNIGSFDTPSLLSKQIHNVMSNGEGGLSISAPTSNTAPSSPSLVLGTSNSLQHQNKLLLSSSSSVSNMTSPNSIGSSSLLSNSPTFMPPSNKSPTLTAFSLMNSPDQSRRKGSLSVHSNNNNNNNKFIDPQTLTSASATTKKPLRSPVLSSFQQQLKDKEKEKEKGSTGEKVMSFLGKMSLSKERMGKLVQQSKENYKSNSGTSQFQSNQPNQQQSVPFEGIFGIPYRVILRYNNEVGNQIPSILHNLFTILESSTSLSTPKLFSLDIDKKELDNIITLINQNQEVNLKAYDTSMCAELLLEFFYRAPEPIIGIEFYETLLNYYQTETLLHLMIRKMNAPNKFILFRLIKYLKDVLMYNNFNETTLEMIVSRFQLFILRPTLGTLSQTLPTISEAHRNTIKDIVTMFIQQADTLFQTPEERSISEESLILYVEDVATNQKLSSSTSTGNMWIFPNQMVWRPKTSPNGDQDLVLPFNNILKIQLSGAQQQLLQHPSSLNSSGSGISTSSSSSSTSSGNTTPSLSPISSRSLSTFTIYCTGSDIKTIITFGFQSISTCKLIYCFINTITKNYLNNLNNQQKITSKLDMYQLDLDSLPIEIKQLSKSLQELNLNKNKFKQLPGDLARLVTLKTISMEENNLSEISQEMADFMGNHMTSLENVSFSNNLLQSIPPLHTWKKLKTLNISNNRLKSLPIDIFQLPNIEVLRASNNLIEDDGIPKVLSNSKLRSLDLRGNRLTTITDGIVNLVELQILTLQDNQITDLPSSIQKLFNLLELNLNNNQIQSLPPQTLLLTNLKKLYLDNNQLSSISSAIHRMQSLTELRLSNNNISRLPPGIVALKKLVSLELAGNRPLRDNIPERYIVRGKEGIFSYFSETMRTNVPCYRTRIIMIGEKSSGKTSLIKCLRKQPKSQVQSITPTNVLDIHDWQCSIPIDNDSGKKKKMVTIHFWEFEGQSNDLSHIFFVPNIIYTIVVNITNFINPATNQPIDHSTQFNSHFNQIITSLNRIYLKDRKSQVFIAATHIDQCHSKKGMEKAVDRLLFDLKCFFPTLTMSIHPICPTKPDGDGISRLRREIKSVVSKNPILKQTYPASFMFFEDYLKEEANIMQPPLVTRKNLISMAKTMDLDTEPHFTQLKSLFNSLGSITSFEQFIRLEAGVSPTRTEMTSLNPIWFAKTIHLLLSFRNDKDQQQKPMPPPSQQQQEHQNGGEIGNLIHGILSHRILRFVWNQNSPYPVPERFFSFFLSILEASDLVINIYQLNKDEQSLRQLKHHNNNNTNFNQMDSRRLSTIMKFTSDIKVRHGRSNSFDARLGWVLISSHLLAHPLPIPHPFEHPLIWEAFPEKKEVATGHTLTVQQFSRHYVLDYTPNGLFGRLISRLMQICNLVKCWNNIAIFSYDEQSERILVQVDCNTIQITTRFIQLSSLSYQIFNIVESLITKYYKVGHHSMVVCSHCIANQVTTPYLFRLEECESSLIRGDMIVYCQHHHQTTQNQRGGRPPLVTKTSNSSLSSSTSSLSLSSSGSATQQQQQISPQQTSPPQPPMVMHRRDSKSSIFGRRESRDSMVIERKESKDSFQSVQRKSTDMSAPVYIKTLLLDQSMVMDLLKEIDFKSIEFIQEIDDGSNIASMNNDQFVIGNTVLSTSSKTGMIGSQSVNVKSFNTPSILIQPLSSPPTSSQSSLSSSSSSLINNSSNTTWCNKMNGFFRHEALSLYTFKHPNILSIIGYSLNPLAIITENPIFGNKSSTWLSDFILDRQRFPEIPWRLKLKIALDVAQAMNYLSSQSPSFILTNLSSFNIILEKSDQIEDGGVIAKLSDLSNLSILPSLFPIDTPPKTWQAPEVLLRTEYHELTDVYSFGIILYELLTRSIAFQDQERFSNLVINGQRPPIPTDCLPSYGDLIKDCWNGDPLNRPTFLEIINRLTLIKKELEGKENNYGSLSSDNNIYSNLPLPSGGSVMFGDSIYHFGGWTGGNSKPHSNVYVLNMKSMILEEKLSVVLANKQDPTYQAFQQHMQSEFNEENLLFYESIRAFRHLPDATIQDREVIRNTAIKIYNVFIGENAPKEINLPFALKQDLKKSVLEYQQIDQQQVNGGNSQSNGITGITNIISVNIFNDTMGYILSSLEDSFHRFKFNSPTSTQSNKQHGWQLLQTVKSKHTPPPTVGHSSLLWRDNLVVIGGWFDGSRNLNQIYMLSLSKLEWSMYNCTGDIPPSSQDALSATLNGDYVILYYERAKHQIFRLDLDTFNWISIKLRNN